MSYFAGVAKHSAHFYVRTCYVLILIPYVYLVILRVLTREVLHKYITISIARVYL